MPNKTLTVLFSWVLVASCGIACAQRLPQKTAYMTAPVYSPWTKDSGLLFWHEAQIRADAGQYPEAIALMGHAYKRVEEDNAGWNPYW
jgi:hypothetical protein